MTIARVASQQTGTYADNATSIALAYPGNVTSGNLLIIGVAAYKASNDAFVVGDISKSAGSATLGSFTLDISRNQNPSGTDYNNVAIFSVPVTGTGSCTITVGGAPAGSYLIIGLEEVSGADVSSTRLESSNSAQSTSGNADSGNVTSAGGALFFGGLGIYSASSNTITPDGSFTQIYEAESSAHMLGSFADRIVTTGTTDSASWTLSPNDYEDWAAAVALYKEAAAATVPLYDKYYRFLMQGEF